MKRQDIDGRPIYSQELWEKMLVTGKILEELGYKESFQIPNLFYVNIPKGKKEIRIFADLRGDRYEPIWRFFRLKLYTYDHYEVILGLQAILLKRFLKVPLEVYNLYPLHISELDGYCKHCGKDIMETKEHYGNNLKIELHYCDECKVEVYEKRRRRKKRRQRAKLCPLCREKNKKVIHHITYEPSNTIDICRSCHNMIHHRYDFPNPLWKQRDPTPKIKKKKERKQNFLSFKLLYEMLDDVRILYYDCSLTDLKVISKFINKFENLHYDLSGDEYTRKDYYYPIIVNLRVGLLEYNKYLKQYNGPDRIIKIQDIDINLLRMLREDFIFFQRQARSLYAHVKNEGKLKKTYLREVTDKILKRMKPLKTKLYQIKTDYEFIDLSDFK